jgi:hypothetical protein
MVSSGVNPALSTGRSRAEVFGAKPLVKARGASAAALAGSKGIVLQFFLKTLFAFQSDSI